MTVAPRSTVMHLVISLDTGGLERFVIDLIKCNQHVFDQFILCLERPGALADDSRLEVVSLDMPPGLRMNFVWRIACIIRERGVDVVHSHNEKAQVYGALAGFLARVPVVHTKHGRNSVTARSFFRINLCSRLCARIVAVSGNAAEQCVREEKIPSAKVQTILNGIDTDLFSPGLDVALLRASLGLGDKPVVGIVARLAPVKDHATLLAACRIMRDSSLDFRLLVVGEGPLREELSALSSALGLNEVVVFTGARRDIPELMNAMDVFVLSSVSEGISLTLAEAMACELPVVATDAGGNSEVVVAGETGYLVPSGAPKALAEGIARLLKDPEERKLLGTRGRIRAVRDFSIKRASQEYEALYDAIMEGR